MSAEMCSCILGYSEDTHREILWSLMQETLLRESRVHFARWASGPAGRKWIRRNRRGSPHAGGYSQPDYYDTARAAMGTGDVPTMTDALLVLLGQTG